MPAGPARRRSIRVSAPGGAAPRTPPSRRRRPPPGEGTLSTCSGPATRAPPRVFFQADERLHQVARRQVRVGRAARIEKIVSLRRLVRRQRFARGWRERQPSGTGARGPAATELTKPRPDPRQQALIATWAKEASYLDIIDAWGEHVYTIRELVAAFHRVEGLYAFTRFRWLNHMALVPEAGGVPLWAS